jgi:hypothetical protein
MSFLRWFASLGVVRRFATSETRHLATAASGFVLDWLLTHHAAQSDAMNIAQAVGMILAGGAGYGLSLINGKGQDVRAAVAAATGTVLPSATSNQLYAKGVQAQQVADQGQADKVRSAVAAADAAAPKDQAALIADLLKEAGQ